MLKPRLRDPLTLPEWAEWMIFILAVLFPLPLSLVALAHAGPMIGIVTALVCFGLYLWVRPRQVWCGSLPFWLEAINFITTLYAYAGLISAIGFCLARLLRHHG